MAPDHGFLLAFLVICSASMLFQVAEVKAEASGDCQRKCGDVEIPYPYGMSKGCYLDEAFRVVCNESSGSASLPLLEWEVESINTTTHTLRHKNFRGVTLPFNSSRGPYVSSFPTVAGNHYSISKGKNKFVAIGCDFLAYLIDEDTGKVQGSCSSLCNPNDIVPLQLSSCSGLFCCEISFPGSLRNLSVWVWRTDYRTKDWENQCAFFTFVEKDFLSFNKIKFSTCNESYVVPMMHEWAVGNTSCDKATESLDEYVCGHNTHCVDYYPVQGYRCECNNGYGGNPYLPQSCQGTGLGVGLLILVAIGIWTWTKLKRIKESKMKQKFFRRNGGLLLQQQILSTRGSALLELILFKIEELEKATDNFSGSRVLGNGGHGTVYKGMLSDGRIVAVKKANIIDDSQQVGQFINEVSILSQINHRHIVKLLGCCLETEAPLLVYEYISNGTCRAYLHDEPKSCRFSWENRLHVAAEVAGALAYMHSYASTAIFHRDVKSSNILLDENYKAVVWKLNDKSDVYAFGVVLAEILTGQKAVSVEDDQGLAFRFRSTVKDDRLFDILDKVVVYEGKEEEILALAKLAKRCLKINAHKRPSMKEVGTELDQLRKKKEVPGHQESLWREYRSMSENCHRFSVGSEAEDDLLLRISF
ncbi:UNVERIFIED_CONTAM: Wall-associated receptor kinase [Sesamum angustifolium]|uniref:Wall-associated receptor kinase n=1 Tax=Sesamum angustifolium TaxID=2727405 RepID=A0AAW2M559_9LAMI